MFDGPRKVEAPRGSVQRATAEIIARPPARRRPHARRGELCPPRESWLCECPTSGAHPCRGVSSTPNMNGSHRPGEAMGAARRSLPWRATRCSRAASSKEWDRGAHCRQCVFCREFSPERKNTPIEMAHRNGRRSLCAAAADHSSCVLRRGRGIPPQARGRTPLLPPDHGCGICADATSRTPFGAKSRPGAAIARAGLCSESRPPARSFTPRAPRFHAIERTFLSLDCRDWSRQLADSRRILHGPSITEGLRRNHAQIP